MNSLPRFLALALFLVLAALVALLVVPASRGVPTRPAQDTKNVRAATEGSSAPAPRRVLALPPRLMLALALVGAVLALALIISLSFRRPQVGGSRTPFLTARSEIGTLAKLAETSVAQGAELSRERDVRRRAEEDAQLKQQLLTQSLDDKIRLGRDLHDGIIQSLYALGLTLETVRMLLKSDPAEADKRLEQMRAGLNGTIRDVRAYIVGLAPENLRRGSFAHSLEPLLNELRAGRDARFDLKIDDEAAALLTPEQSLEALQIAREAASNALRHGAASLITVRVHKSDREVCLLVQDNGAGFDAAAQREGGHGLGNMRARAERLRATLRVASEPGQGVRVIVTIPLLQPAAI